MSDLEHITHLEIEGYQPSGRLLGSAFALLTERWASGQRDRETTLRLMFLTWYNCADQPFAPDLQLRFSIEELFEHLGGESSVDAELLYAVARMAELFPWCCGPEALWQERALRCSARARNLLPQGPSPEAFQGRGAYGAYFAHLFHTREGAA